MIKKAILTGGGHATRLRPITTTLNKHLIPLANKPMIFHAIEKVVKCGVSEIFINTNPGETELQKVVGNGERWGVKITFFEQTGGPQGIAHVVKQAQKFIGDDPFMFYLSDNIILSDLDLMVKKFAENNYDCMLALSEVKDPQRFGVPFFDKKNELIDVIEKPSNPPNNFVVTGIYLYSGVSFFTAFDHIKKSNRGEYEISSIHSYFLKNKYKVGYQKITGWWKDTGMPDDLIVANSFIMDQLDRKKIVGDNTNIGTGVEIKEPVVIGSNCVLENCTILPHTSIGNNCVIKKAQIGNSLVFDNCHIDCDTKIENSIIGKRANISGKKDGEEHRFILGDNAVVKL